MRSTAVITITTALGVAATAHASLPVFEAAIVAAGTNPGYTPADSITVPGGTFYHDAFDSDRLLPPLAAGITAIPSLALDTYLNLNLQGPVSPTNPTSGLLATPQALSENPELIGAISSSLPQPGRGVSDRWHVARLSAVGSSAQPVGELMVAALRGDIPGVADVVLNLDGTPSAWNGLGGPPPTFEVFLDTVDATSTIDPALLASTGVERVWDIYIQTAPSSIPSPGAAAMLGLAGLAATRRRR